MRHTHAPRRPSYVADGDGSGNTILDCEIAAGRALNQQAIAAGAVGEVGVVFFDSGATIRDVDPATPGTRGLTGPATDASGSGSPDVEEVPRSANDGGNTTGGRPERLRARPAEPSRLR